MKDAEAKDAKMTYLYLSSLNLFRHILLLFSLLFLPIFAEESLSEISHDEALHVRRILEFWKDEEPAIVKTQIRDFLLIHPESEYRDSLLLILGDIYWKENKFNEALATYRSIHAPSIQSKVYNNLLDCLYHLEQFDELKQELTSKVGLQRVTVASNDEQLWIYYLAEAHLKQAKKLSNRKEAVEEYQQAKTLFEQLLKSGHAENADLALAEISIGLGLYKDAAKQYNEIAEKYPSKKEESLLQSARLFAEESPDEALRLYTQLQYSGTANHDQVVIERISLLYNMGRYSRIVAEEEDYRLLQSGSQDLAHFYLGRSFFELKDYNKAIDYLEPLAFDIRNQENNKELHRSILLTLIAAHFELGNWDVVYKWADTFGQLYQKEPSYAQALLAVFLSLKSQRRWDEARSTLAFLENKFPDFDQLERIDYEKGDLLFKEEKWQEARAHFYSFAKRYPKSELVTLARQYIPHCSHKLLQFAEATNQQASTRREELLKDIEEALNSPLPLKQKLNYYLEKARVLYYLNRVDEAKATLIQLSHEELDPNLSFQVHLLLAISFHEGQGDFIQFIEHGEKALSLNAMCPEADKIHLNLFNAYLRKGNECRNASEKETVNGQAAGHLFTVFAKGEEKIKEENQIWLANHYYNQIKQRANEYFIEPLASLEMIEKANRSSVIYKKIFSGDGDVTPWVVKQEKMAMELELYKWSNICGWLGHKEKQQWLLNELARQQTENGDWPWSLRSRVSFSRAFLRKQQGDKIGALEEYEKLIKTPRTTDSLVSNASKLEWARISYEALDPSRRSLEDEKMIEILTALK